MKVKTFSVDEANKLLPKIKECFDDVYLLRKKASFMKGEMKWITEFWGKDLYDSDNADHDKFLALEKDVEDIQEAMAQKIEKVESFGCIVKDIGSGLVDFYSVINNSLAFLCWKYGESSINHWHEIEGGYDGRKPISSIDRIKNK